MQRYDEDQMTQIDRIKQEYEHKLYSMRKNHEESKNEDQGDSSLCPNCKEMIPERHIATHTVQCYRNSTKCKICKEVIGKADKKSHILQFRDLKKMKKAI